jgi:hygromycin-B 4-O-kinase
VRVRAFLQERFADVESVVPIAHGAWSRAYVVHRGARTYVARFSPTRDDFDKDVRAARFASPALPVPPQIEVGEALAGYYAITAHVPGDFLERLDAGAMRAALPSLFAALDAMREADVSSSGFGVWRPDGDAPHPTWRAALLDVAHDRPGARTHGWRRALDAAPTGAAAFDAAYGKLESLAAGLPDARHLVHSDLTHYNVLVDGARVTAVLDWGSSLYGDFLYDLAWISFWAPWYPAWRDVDFEREALRHYGAIGLHVPAFAERIAAAKLHIGLDGMAYNAFRRDWPALDATAARTLDLTRT